MRHILLNGRLVPARRASIPVLDRAVMPGLGLFESLRVYDGEPFLLHEHLARMRVGARRLGIRMPVVRGIDRLIAADRVRNAVLRIILTGGGPGVRPSLIAMTDALPAVPSTVAVEPVAVARGPLAGVKSLNYLENRMIRDAARRRGFYEAVFVTPRGELLEGTSSNIFAVIGGRVVTPPLRGILPGITRARVMRLADVRERRLTLRDLRRAGEVFITSALIEVVPVRRVGAIRFRNFAVARALREAYR